MGYTRGMIYFAASGLGYDDWVGRFYSIGMPEQEDNTSICKASYEVLKLITGGGNQLVLSDSCG